jgi:hypothetical protein
VCSHYCPIDAPKILIQSTAIDRILGKAINDLLKRSVTIPTIKMLEHSLPGSKFWR